MLRILQFAGQTAVYAATALLFAAFSNSPTYVHFPPDQAALRLNIVHSAERREKCRRLTPQEIAELAPNMRKAQSCPRERLPVWIEVVVDGETLVEAALPPAGLSGDGPSKLDRRLTLAPGSHSLVLRLRDTNRREGYDYELERQIVLRPRDNLVIDFRPEQGGFVLL